MKKRDFLKSAGSAIVGIPVLLDKGRYSNTQQLDLDKETYNTPKRFEAVVIQEEGITFGAYMQNLQGTKQDS